MIIYIYKIGVKPERWARREGEEEGRGEREERRERGDLTGVGLLFQQHVVVGRETHTSFEDVLDACTLTEESINKLSVLGDKRSLEEVGEDGEDGVELVVLGGHSGGRGGGLVGDAGHELGEHDEVVDDGGSKERVLACVVKDNGVVASHEDLACVLVHGSLGIANIGDILRTENK